MTQQQQLYAHEAASLVPLLESQLPYTMAVLGCIHASPDLRTVYASFPAPCSPSSSSWLVTLALANGQIYLFHSAEIPGSVLDASHAEAEVVAAVRAMVALYPSHRLVGALHTRWGGALRAAGVSFQRGPGPNLVFTVFIAPHAGPGIEVDNVDMGGLVLDAGMPGDEDIVSGTTKFHSAEYVRSRREAGYMTAVRPAQAPAAPAAAAAARYVPPVAWIITHSNGSQGALYTVPAYRRRGLARLVTAERIQRTQGYRSFVYVEVGNTVSENLWEARGWERGWEVTWEAV